VTATPNLSPARGAFDRALRILSLAVLVAVVIASARLRPPIPFSTTFDYRNRPAGYDWRPQRDRNTHDIVYYGVDPLTHENVYVGPDSIYYRSTHPPQIAPGLWSTWIP
jgi:hypothetical protein